MRYSVNMKIFNILALSAILILSLSVITSGSSEQVPTTPTTLIMFHNPSCPYCNRFLNEVCLTTKEDEIRNTKCPGYFSEYSPILIVTKNTMPDWITRAVQNGKIRPIIYTPTFVLWNGEREVGRIIGYGGEDWFNKRLEKLIIEDLEDRPQKSFYRVN